MDTILLEIIEEIRRGTAVDHRVLARILHEHNKNLKDNRDHFAKKHLLPYYFNAKNTKEELWRAWNVDEQTERALITAPHGIGRGNHHRHYQALVLRKRLPLLSQ